MTLWNAVTSTATVATQGARAALRWGEDFSPWPLSLIPRTLRLPLDVAAVFIDPGSDVARGRHAMPSGPPREARGERGAQPVAAAASPRPRRATPGKRAGEAQQMTAAAPPPAAGDTGRTATIAGTRSDGDDDAPRYDREVRARLTPLYTRDAGSGPSLVLLHAFPLNGRMWEPQLESLADRFRVLAPDFAGFGLSWTPDSSFSLEDQAAAVEVSLDDLHVDEMVLVGLSMGGYVTLTLYERLARRVRGLVLANTRATADGEATAIDRHRLAAEVEASGVAVVADELLPRMIGTSTLRDRPELVDRVRAIILENKEAAIAAALRAMAARPDATPVLRGVRCPVLLIAGEEDALTSLDDARYMKAHLRDARLEVLSRAGHLSNLETPDEFSRVLADFARSLPATGRGSARARAAGRT